MQSSTFRENKEGAEELFEEYTKDVTTENLEKQLDQERNKGNRKWSAEQEELSKKMERMPTADI